jgi:hypothetical protein
LPLRLNWVSAVAEMFAASATDSSPAAARLRDARSPPPRMSFVETPAFAISVMPSAASVAEYCVSRPAAIAA